MLRDRQTSEGLLEPEVCILPLGGELWNQEPGPDPSLEPWNQFKFGLEPEPGTGFNPVQLARQGNPVSSSAQEGHHALAIHDCLQGTSSPAVCETAGGTGIRSSPSGHQPVSAVPSGMNPLLAFERHGERSRPG